MGGGFTRQYIILRGMQGKGFARVEMKGGQGRMVIRAGGLPSGGILRALLVSGRGEGCVLDLGKARTSPGGNAIWERLQIPLPSLQGYDAVAVTTDWPEGEIILSGYLASSVRCGMERLRKVVEQYLCMPCQDMELYGREHPGESVLRLRART